MEREKRFVFNDVTYSIEFPTVGQFIDIESEKVKCSDGQWGNFIKAGTLSGLRAIQVIECIAILTALCPKIIENLKTKSFLEIDAKDFIVLVKIYQKEILPWYSEWFKEFNDILKEE